MKRRRLYIAAVTAVLAMLGLGAWSDNPRFHAKCDTLALTSNLERRLEFQVSLAEMPRFNDSLVSYLRDSGFTYETSENADYLSPPDARGNQIRFLNVKTIGCTSDHIVWSENVIREDTFIITIHRTPFGSTASASRIASDLERILSGAQRHDPARQVTH